MIELLISKGADINAKATISEGRNSKSEKTSLHIAIENESNKIGELLISKGADINAKGIIHQNILYLFLIILIEIK